MFHAGVENKEEYEEYLLKVTTLEIFTSMGSSYGRRIVSAYISV